MFTVRPLNCEVPSHLANVLRNVYFKKSIDSTDVMYQVRRSPWRCAFYNLANVAREEVPGLVPLTNRP